MTQKSANFVFEGTGLMDSENEDLFSLIDEDEVPIITENDHLFSQFQASRVDEVDFGQNAIAWKRFINNTSSGKVYSARIYDFLEWVMNKREETSETNDLHVYLIFYFDAEHCEVKGDLTPRYGPTTLRGWFSMFMRFWQLSGKGHLRTLCPSIELDLLAWESDYNVKVATTFCKEDIVIFYGLPNTPEILSLKLFLVLAIHIAARSCETTNLTWGNVDSMVDSRGVCSYKITFERKKRRGLANAQPQYCLITGTEEVVL